jgi:hypothetical protein
MSTHRPIVSVTYRFIDGRGKAASISFDADATQTLDSIHQAAAAVADQLMLVSNATLVGYTLTYSVLYLSPERQSTDSRVEHKGVIGFRTAQGKQVTYQIPAIRMELVHSNRRLKSSGTAITGLAQLLLQPPWCDSNGERLMSFSKAYEAFRRTK